MKIEVGDMVRIPNTTYVRGRVVEDRGNLGPNGMRIFRVRCKGCINIELREDQISLLKKKK